MSKLKVVPGGGRTPLAQLVDDYLADLQARGRSRRTIAQYQYNLQRVLLPFCEREGITQPEELGQAALNRLTTQLLDGHLSRPTVHSYVRSVNQWLNWARSEDLRKRTDRAARRPTTAPGASPGDERHAG